MHLGIICTRLNYCNQKTASIALDWTHAMVDFNVLPVRIRPARSQSFIVLDEVGSKELRPNTQVTEAVTGATSRGGSSARASFIENRWQTISANLEHASPLILETT
jgi:hypothetical protein